MDRLERFYKIDHLLQASKVVPLHSLQEELEVSPATLKRDLEYMRSRFQCANNLGSSSMRVSVR